MRGMATWLSVLCSLITAGIVVWRGGALANMVESHERRVLEIELHGSPGLREHVKEDDERVKGLVARVDRAEDTMKLLGEMKADIREIKTELRLISAHNDRNDK